MAGRREKVEAGSGDVFVDLGYTDAGERKLRVQLAMQVNELIAGHGLTQAKASALLGIAQPHVSDLKNYKLTRFSSERLLRFLTLLDRKSTRLNSSHQIISYAVFCLKKK